MAAQYKSTAKLNRASAAPNPLPEKIGLVLQESRWLALVALAVWLRRVWRRRHGGSEAVTMGGPTHPAGDSSAQKPSAGGGAAAGPAEGRAPADPEPDDK